MAKEWYDAPKLFSQKDNTVFRYGFDGTFHTKDRNPVGFYHYHDFYEIVFYLGDAPLSFRCDDTIHEIHRGDIILCDMFTPHVYMCEDNEHYDRFSVCISPRLLTSFSADLDYSRLFRTDNPFCPVYHPDFLTLSRYLSLISDYRDYSTRSQGAGVRRAMIHLLLSYLYDDCSPSLSSVRETGAVLPLVNELIGYIDAHCTETITLETLAEHTHYSVSYITRIFRRYTGETLVQYLTDKRILRAKRLLGEDIPLSEIAERTGFQDYSHFYKCFMKSEGMKPSEFRRQMQDDR